MARLPCKPPCQTLQNPPWLRHRPNPPATIILDYALDKERQLRFYGSPHRRFSVSRPPSACEHSPSRPSHRLLSRMLFGYIRRPARFVLNADVDWLLPQVVFLFLECLSWGYVHSDRCYRAQKAATSLPLLTFPFPLVCIGKRDSLLIFFPMLAPCFSSENIHRTHLAYLANRDIFISLFLLKKYCTLLDYTLYLTIFIYYNSFFTCS